MKSPTVLLYSVPSDIHRRIEALGGKIGFECKKIGRKRFLQSIGCHAGLPGFEQTEDWYEGNDLPIPMLVFSGFSDQELDRFLAEYKQDNLPSDYFRAIITGHNMHWNVLQLYQELAQERESLQAFGK